MRRPPPRPCPTSTAAALAALELPRERGDDTRVEVDDEVGALVDAAALLAFVPAPVSPSPRLRRRLLRDVGGDTR